MGAAATAWNGGETLFVTATTPLTQKMGTRQCRETVRNGKWHIGVGVKYVCKQNPIKPRASHHKERQGNSPWTQPQLFLNTILMHWGERGESGFQRDLILKIIFYETRNNKM